eukprot:scaffold129484_cov63-Phaeocystis_antarctica.AAC.4
MPAPRSTKGRSDDAARDGPRGVSPSSARSSSSFQIGRRPSKPSGTELARVAVACRASRAATASPRRNLREAKKKPVGAYAALISGGMRFRISIDAVDHPGGHELVRSVGLVVPRAAQYEHVLMLPPYQFWLVGQQRRPALICFETTVNHGAVPHTAHHLKALEHPRQPRRPVHSHVRPTDVVIGVRWDAEQQQPTWRQERANLGHRCQVALGMQRVPVPSEAIVFQSGERDDQIEALAARVSGCERARVHCTKLAARRGGSTVLDDGLVPVHCCHGWGATNRGAPPT